MTRYFLTLSLIFLIGCSSDSDDASVGLQADTRVTGDTAAPVDVLADIGGTDVEDTAPFDEVAVQDVAVDAGNGADATQADTAGELDAVEPDTVLDIGATDAGTTDVAEPVLVSTPHTITTSDGKNLAALLHQHSDAEANSPGVVLVHQFVDSKAQWTPYVADLTALGWRVLAIDLRGHGESDDQNGSFNGLLSDPAQAPLDVETAIDWLVANADVDAARIAIVGTSIGANLACVAMANDYGVKLAVAISPRQSAVESLAGSTGLTFNSLYCAAAENDGGGAQKDTCLAFQAASGDPKSTVIIENSAVHGKTLLSSLPDEWTAIVDFLNANL